VIARVERVNAEHGIRAVRVDTGAAWVEIEVVSGKESAGVNQWDAIGELYEMVAMAGIERQRWLRELLAED
jgi:hypothetical protein